MSDYRAPLGDYAFILNRLIGPETRAGLSAFEAVDEELATAILDEAARFAEGVLAPLNAPGDRQGCRLEAGQVHTPAGWAEAYGQFRDAGWTGLALPEAIGGQGLPKLLATAVTEGWQGANLAFSMFQPLTEGAVEALEAGGATDLLERYGPALASGEMTATMALTEAGAGSDLGLLKTRAEPDAKGGYRLTGDKLYISYGAHDFTDRILHLVLARLPDAPAGSKGISLFAVPSHTEDGTANGVTCTGIEEKLGLHASPTCALAFEGARGELIGEPNRGLAIMFVMMNEARLSVGLQGVAVIERAYQAALAWARERRQGRHIKTGEPATALIEHPDIRRLLLRLRSQTLASRLLASHLALRLDQARQPNHPEHQSARREVELLTPVFKAYSTEVANRLTGDAIQIFGGMGFIEETGVAQYYRDLRISTIYEGTTGIQAQDLLARKIARDNGEAFFTWLDEIETDIADLKHHSRCQNHWATLTRRIGALRGSVRSLLDDHGDDPAHLQAASVALLEAVGLIASAWQLARAVLAAEDNAYGHNLEHLLAFYCGHFLAEVRTHLARVEQASAGLEYEFG